MMVCIKTKSLFLCFKIGKKCCLKGVLVINIF